MKKKILHLLYSDSFSGAENVATSIIQNLNNEYDFVYVSKDGDIKNILKEKGIKCHLIEKVNIKTVRRVIKEERPDIVHAHDYFASTFAAISGFKGTIISHIHNNYPFAKRWNIYTIIYKIISKKFKNIIFVSKKTFDETIYKKSIHDKAVILPNIADEAMIKKMAKEKNELGKFDVGFIGRITEQKNPSAFIDIVQKISEKMDIKAVMIGEGESINAKGLNITKTGFINNPYKVLKDCKCVIMPSKWEGFGLTAIECLILDVPVFNSGEGGLSEIFKNNKEYICKDNTDYINKVMGYLNNPVINRVDINKYTDKKAYYSTIRNIYES